MRILCVFGQHNYGDEARGEGIEYTQFLPAFRRLGHETFFFESFARSKYSGFAALNRALLQEVERVRPDVVFSVLMLSEIWLETIAFIRAAGCKVVNWSTDDSWKYREFSRLIATEFDLFATTCPDALSWYAADNISNVRLTQWGASAAWLRNPQAASKCKHQVTFIGSAYGTRPARIAALRKAGIEVECFGYGWPNGPLPAERMPEVICNSQISLNFSEAGGGSGRQLKARIFEVPAAGGLLLTESAPHLEKYFSLDREICVFENDEQLVAQARALLANHALRDAVCQAGFARTQREHTYDSRMRELLAHFDAPTAILEPIDWQAFERVCATQRLHPGLVLLRWILVAPCVLIWGGRRGKRAARRIMFELSWRLWGRRTYTAAGWPGRLFYRES